ncbi:fumarylacetoacetase [Marinactinospora rubrisoli]|uniref:fumarylacetoacetase n=1 Tax=Marinactinospora rubrisoli TaxID=2715399 RepID=A0ABW2KPV8_9ACTN
MAAEWLDVPAGSAFGTANLPYGVFSIGAEPVRRVGVAVGDRVLDVGAVARAVRADFAGLLGAESLNPLLAAGPAVWRSVRAAVRGWLSGAVPAETVLPHLVDRAAVRLHLPFEVADYVDFYSCEQHAVNAGRIFRPDAEEPLPPNWRHLPIGYHGRAGTLVVSGTDVVRPSGQRREPGREGPVFGPSARLDFEAEVGFVVGVPSPRGRGVRVADFAEHVFGAFLVNDWSARDLQAWEYVPLGPFLGKSFATSVSPWVVPLAALSAARVAPPPRDPEPLPYLRDAEGDPWGLDLRLTVRLNGHVVSRPPFARMYWTPAQQLAHLTVNGAAVRTGDVFASGTVSGPERGEWGSLLELSWNGADPVRLPDGRERGFLRDGDVVSISATAPGPGGAVVGFGEVTGRVLPAVGNGPNA